MTELIADARAEYYDYSDEMHESGMSVDQSSEEYIADHLLANGVIVPPCKVGDVVYIKALKERLPFVVTQISIKKSGIYYEADRIRNKKGNLLYFHDITSVVFDDTDFGKTVFLTRSQAEEALKNRE